LKAVVVRKHGGPEVLECTELPLPDPGSGQVRVRIKAIGINRRDAFIRAGIYPRALPLIPGIEAAGIIDAVGAGVQGWAADERVVYYVPDLLGAYAEYQVVPAQRLVRLPAGLSFEDAAALFDHGLTAHYLTTSTFVLRQGHRVLIHAAAGGVGSLLLQLAKRAGTTVYGTVSTPEKSAFVRKLGCEHAIPYRQTDFVEAVKQFTNGEGVDVVYDSVGVDTIQGSMRCLKPRGTLVLYGQSSGEVSAIHPAALADAGSLYFTRPHLAHHIATPEALHQRSRDIFTWYLRGEISLNVDRTYPLSHAAQAHQRLEDRASFGKILLIP
jgi:NADPH:quinone reductase